jgi:hypothetical protein
VARKHGIGKRMRRVPVCTGTSVHYLAMHR